MHDCKYITNLHLNDKDTLTNRVRAYKHEVFNRKTGK